MNFKRIIQDYFTFSRNERKGITVLLILIFLLAVANKFIFYFETPGKIDLALLDSAGYKLNLNNDSINQNVRSKSLFYFNPNTIDSIALDSLDVPDFVKSNLLRFRNKGGKFYSSSDFGKIYGVTSEISKHVDPYLLFEDVSRSKVQVSSVHKLFLFDPNEASDHDFLLLGLSEFQVASIRKYMEKGGVFRTKEDFLNFRVIGENQKKILSDYISIQRNHELQVDAKNEYASLQLSLNAVDSIQLKQLPGIGVILSKRIIKYRDLLGGFYSVHQLKEVYGLSEQTFNRIEDKVFVDIKMIKKLNVNFLDEFELAKHPYLSKNLARKIVKFRTKYGSIHDFNVFRDSMILNMVEYDRIKPYF